jgi:hypothetical protein
VVSPENDLNAILNSTKGGDMVLIKSGTYNIVSLSDKRFSDKNPLVIRAFDSMTVSISGNSTPRGTSLEITGCSYVKIEG